MNQNVGTGERLLSLAAGLALLTDGVRRRGVTGAVEGFAGGLLAYRAAIGFCVVRDALDRGSKPASGALSRMGESNPDAAVPYGSGHRVERTIRIARPRTEVYAYWRDFTRLPTFMTNLERVEIALDDPRRSRWTARGPAGSISWNAEIIEDVPNAHISWRSVEGSHVRNAGSVRFADAGGDTDVIVEIEYAPPAGDAGVTVAQLLGVQPQRQVDEDLERFRQLLESETARRSS